MKKKLLIFLLAVISVICLVFGISACNRNKATASVTSVSLNTASVSLEVGDVYVLTATVSPDDAANKNVGWASYNESVAVVTDGTVIAVGEGMTVVVATSEDSGKIAVCTVTVTEKSQEEATAATSVSLNATELSLEVGEAATLIANVLPADAANKNVIWWSTDSSIVAVSGGTIAASSVGSAIITVKTLDGGYTATCVVTVTEKNSEEVAISSVSLNTTSLSLKTGDEATLVTTILPEDATNQEIIWCSSDPSVAIVSEGQVMAVSAGTAVITATCKDGGSLAVCLVTVAEPEVAVISVSLNVTAVALGVGDTYALEATILPANATNQKIIWSSSDSSVATVSDGEVTAVAEGSAVIMATSDDGGKLAVCAITVMQTLVDIPVTSVSLDMTSLSMEIEDAYTLTAAINPEYATDQSVIWESSDETVATVSDGKVTAVSAGSAVITVTTVDGSYTAVCSVSVTESAANLEYTLSDDNSFYYVTGYSGSASVVEIPNVHNGLRVSKIYSSVFSGNKYITQITLPDTIETIGSYAFSGCVNLKTINIPQSVSAIEEYTFEGCTSLTTVATDNYLNSIKTIGAYAFENCTALADITFGDVTSVSEYAFNGCTALAQAAFGSVAKVSEYAFNDCTALAQITFGDVISLGSDAFNGCTALNQVSFDSVTTIDSCAFKDCTALQRAALGFATYINESAFEGCTSLVNVTFISVSIIGDSAFADCSNLSEINFPVGLISIGDYAFDNCKSLTSVVLPDSVTSVGVAAFRYAESLQTVTLSANMSEISNATFQYCVSLGSIDILSGINTIGNSAFSYCYGLEEINIYGDLSSVGNSAFYLCTGIESIYYCSSSDITIGDENFIFYNAGINGKGITFTVSDTAFIPEGLFEPDYQSNMPNITAIIIEEGATEIAYFSEYHNLPYLTSVTIPSTVTYISEGFISGCANVVETENGVNYIDKHAVAYTADVQSVTLRADTVVIIENAFENCATLTSITIPNSVETIGKEAFYGCTSLVNLTIGEGVIVIGKGAFKNCTGLKSIIYNVVEAEDLTIGNAVFYYAGQGDTGITVTIGSMVKSIPAYLFYSDTNIKNSPVITKINFADNGVCETIGDYAFAYCDELESIAIPNSVETIGEGAFRCCTSLKTVTVPESVTLISEGAFGGCSSMVSITLPFVGGSAAAEEASQSTLFGYIFGSTTYSGCDITVQQYSDNGTAYYFVPSSLTTVTITGGNIFYGAFSNCANIISVTLPEDITSISDKTFYGCASLGSIGISESVTSIGEGAYYGCTSLTSVVVPDSVTSIGEGAFGGCTSLESITLPFVGGSAKTSGDTYQYAFGYIFGTTYYSGGTATLQVYYGASIYNTTSETYYIPDTLTTVTITGGNILCGAFSDCANIVSITLPENITSIGGYAFYGCASLENITIPESVTTIGESAFYGCESLESIGIPEKITIIGEYAFYGCALFESVVVPDSVTSIGEGAFGGCTSLESITLPFVGGSANATYATETTLFGYIFGTAEYTGGTATVQYYSDSEYITYCIPDMLTTVTITGGNILYGAFCNCANIVSITLPENITSIGGYAFYGCELLENVTIPESVTSIGESAYYGCISLTSVVVPDKVTSIGEGAFGGCTSLESITLPFVGGSANATYASEATLFGYIFGTAEYTGGTATVQYYSDSEYITYYIPDMLTTVTITGGKLLYGAFSNCANIVSITLPENITSIGDCAFYGCASLENITIPEKVTTIGENVFYGCESLTSITVGGSNSCYKSVDGNLYSADGTTLIRYAAGKDETTFTVPDTTTNIASYAFAQNTALTSVVIHSGVTSIGESAFSGCSALVSITLPFVGGSASAAAASETTLFGYIFGTDEYTGSTATMQNYGGVNVYYYVPTTLTTVTVTGGSILYGAFYNCTNLTSVTIGEDVTEIGERAFYNCTGLTGINYNAAAVSDLSSSNYAFYKAGYSGNGITVNIGAGVTNIPAYLFYSYSTTTYAPEITSVVFADNSICTGIGNFAFGYCSSLTSITLPESLMTIGYRAFYNCSSLNSVTFENVEGWNVATSATASNCTAVSSTILSVASNAATYLKTTYVSYYWHVHDYIAVVTAPTCTDYGYTTYTCSVCGDEYIDDYTEPSHYYTATSDGQGNTTYNCTVCGDNYTVGYELGYTLSDDETYYIVSGIGTCTETEIVIPYIYNNLPVKEIASYAFYFNSTLTSVVIGNNVTTIGSHAFGYCTSLTSIVIPDSVTTIDSCAFYCCTNLASITIGSGVTTIGTYAFYNTAYYNETGNWTNGVLYIGSYLIKADTTLAGSYSIKAGTTLIADYAFADCSLVTTVYLCDGCNYIGQHAFSDCFALTTVYFYQTTVPVIGSDVFAGTWDASEFAVYVLADLYSGYQSISDSYWQNSIVSAGKLYTI